MIWLLRGFTLHDPRKSYPGFYLSPQQSYVMSVVREEDEISPGEVAKKLRLEKSHLTKIVNSLIDLGAMEKKTDPSDRRKLVLHLTKKGEEILRELDKVGIASYREFMHHIPEKEREPVIHAVEVMLEAMEEMRKEQ